MTNDYDKSIEGDDTNADYDNGYKYDVYHNIKVMLKMITNTMI